MTIAGWFDRPASALADIRTADGWTAGSDGIDRLIDAMARFDSDWSAAHQGAPFDPAHAAAAITDMRVLAVERGAWQH